MSIEPIPFVEGEPPPSPKHIRAILHSEDGAPDQDVWILPETLQKGPLRHEDIDALLPMIRWQWRHISKYATWCRSFEDWELGFMRDTSPASEVAVFLRVTYAFLHFMYRNPLVEKSIVFNALVAIVNGQSEQVRPDVMLNKLEQLLSDAPQWLADPENYTTDGYLKRGEPFIR